jgi:hypothetical protein
MTKNSEQLFECLEKARLLSAADIEQARKRWNKSDRSHSDSASHCAKWLVTNQFLTPYQSGRILAGDTEDLRVGNFLVRDQIQGGAFDGALIAQDPLLRQVVIQFGTPAPTTSSRMHEALKNLRETASKIDSLENHHVQKVVGQGTHRGKLFVAREWWEGCSLSAALKRKGKVEARKACKIFASVLGAAQALHEVGLPVGIVDPNSIYLAVESPGRGEGRVVKLLGAGLSPGFLVETKDKAFVSHSEEVFSIGRSMYEVVTGEPYPLDGAKRKQVASLVPEVSNHLAEYIDQLADPEPGIRFESAKIAGKALRILIATEDAEGKLPHVEDPIAEVNNFPVKNREAAVSEEEVEKTDWLSEKVDLLLARFGVSPRELVFLAGGALATIAFLLVGLLVLGDMVPLIALGLGAMGGYYLNAWLARKGQVG